MATRPAVSVIIPVYNGEKYLRGCLDSVFSQTLKQLQVICVDDGSTDHSAQILSEYQNMHPDLVIVSQENGGLSAARNAGIRRATGEYIDFLDCDDTLRTDALETLYRRAHEDALDMLLYDGKTIFASEELRQANPGYETLYRTKIHIGNKPMSGEELFVRLVDSGSYRASACMYLLRLDYLMAKGYTFIQGIYYEDNVFTLQCLLDAARCGVEAIPFYHRSLRGSSIVTTHKDFRHARSYYVCETAMQNFLFARSLGADTIRCARQQISSLRHHALSVYAALSDDERKQAMAMYPDAILIDDMLHTSATASPKPAPRKKTEPAPAPEWMSRTQLRSLTGQPYQPDHPFVSVIVPVYNAADYLQDTLHDLQSQTLQNIEILFVDDGSSDGSAQIIEQHAASDPRIQLFRQQNQFAGVARNHGMDHARGEYLLFLDADDRFSPNLAAYAYACAKHNSAQIVLFHADLLQMPQKTYAPAAFLCPCNRLPGKVFSGNDGRDHIFDVLNPWTKLFQRSYIQQLGIRYQPLFSSNDLYFSMVAMACAERIAPLPEVLVHYRVGLENNIQSQKSKAPLDTFHAFSAVKQELESRGIFDVYRKPFAVKAAESMLRSLDTMTSLDRYRELYQVLHNGGLENMGLGSISSEDMRHISNGAIKLERCRTIRDTDFDSYLLSSVTSSTPQSPSGQKPQLATSQEIARLQDEVNALRHSYAYRIGRKITWPFHVLKQLLLKC